MQSVYSTVPADWVVFLFNTNNLQTDLFDTVGILTGNTTPDQSGTGSNGKESQLQTPYISRTGTLSLDAL